MTTSEPVVSVRGLPGGRSGLVVGAFERAERLVVFFHGFMTSPSSYRTVLAALADERTVVAAPRMYRRGPFVLAGRPTVSEEADAAVSVIEHLRMDGTDLWVAGHSRGGQVAWLIADRVDPAGVIVIDPVDGTGRHPTELHAAASPVTFAARTLVIGAGRGGRCAPAPVNHEHFASAASSTGSHVVIPTMGHADLLDDRPARFARMLCAGSEHPELDRETVGIIAHDFIGGGLPSASTVPVPFEQR